MIDHNKIKTIQTDIYNKFYLTIKEFAPSEESWKKILELGNEFAEKHKQDRIAKILILAYEDIIESEWEAAK